MTMPDDPIDFSSLDPTADGARFDSIARQLAGRAMAARAIDGSAGAAQPDALTLVARWWRPVLLAAGLAIAATLPALNRLVRSTSAEQSAAPVARVGTLGIPAAVSDLLRATQTPSVGELAAALNSNVQ